MRAVVTGASSGIGEATVRRFRAAGWDVVALARRADRLKALAAETGAVPVVADVTDDASVAAAVARIAALGPVHALVNNAGGAFGVDRVEDAALDDWQRMFDVNVLGVQRMIAALLPQLRAGVEPGGAASIVTITSTAAYASYEGGAGYNAAKAGVRAVINALRLELAGEPIRVIQVAPGMVKTEEFSLNRLAGDRERADAVYQGVENPLSGDDVALVVLQAVELPPHVNMDEIVVRPVAQAANFKVARGPLQVR